MSDIENYNPMDLSYQAINNLPSTEDKFIYMANLTGLSVSADAISQISELIDHYNYFVSKMAEGSQTSLVTFLSTKHANRGCYWCGG